LFFDRVTMFAGGEKKCNKRLKNLQFAVKLYLSDRKDLSENTIKTYSYIFRDFVNNMPVSLNDITVETLEIYFMKMNPKYSPKTVNIYINAIKSFFKWLAKYGYLNIGYYVQNVPALPPIQRIISQQEYEKVCGRVNGYMSDCFRLLCNTGLRATEFINLRPDNLSNGFLRVIGKGRRNRSIPLNKTALEIVRRFPDFSFIKRRNRVWLWRLCKRIAYVADIPDCSPHACRHYFANELYHKGVDMYTISRLLGHADTKVTENVYVHWAEDKLQGVTDVLD